MCFLFLPFLLLISVSLVFSSILFLFWLRCSFSCSSSSALLSLLCFWSSPSTILILLFFLCFSPFDLTLLFYLCFFSLFAFLLPFFFRSLFPLALISSFPVQCYSFLSFTSSCFLFSSFSGLFFLWRWAVPFDFISLLLQSVGCDQVLGSSAALDFCGVCKGDNSTCRLYSGRYDLQHRANGKPFSGEKRLIGWGWSEGRSLWL